LTSWSLSSLINLVLRNRLLESVGLDSGSILGQGNSEVLNSSLEYEGVKALLEGLEDILEHLRSNVVDLIQALYSVLDDLSDRDDLVHGLAHGSQSDLSGTTLSELGEHVGDVVSEGLSLCDADLVVGGRLTLVSNLSISCCA